MESTDFAIVVDDVVKTYAGKSAVNGVSFQVRSGECFGVLGPNGAGKTTLLEMIEGLRKPDGGSISVLGESPWPRNAQLLPRIGVQLQASAFFDKLSAREQLECFADLYNRPRSVVSDLLEQTGLTEKADTVEDKLSGGQRQRLSIACALVNDPDVVFLDEPTAALDPQARRNLWDVLRRIQEQGKTLVLTTHHLDEAELLCDRVAVMDNGEILALDAPANLVRGLQAPSRIVLPSGVLAVDDARTIVGVDDVESDEASLTLVAQDASPVLTELANRRLLDGLQVRTATLEDVFLSLTGREYRA